MTALLDRRDPPVHFDRFALAFAQERVWLEGLARSAEAADLRAQALVELMGLEASCDDELAFERLRRELGGLNLPPAVATLYRAHAAVGLMHFGRTVAAERCAARPIGVLSGAALGDWLLELDHLLDRAVQ